MDPFKVPIPIEGLMFPPIKNPSDVDSIHQRAVLFPEKQDIKVEVKMKHHSISMEEFPETTKESMGGKSVKVDKGLGKNIPAESNLDLKHLIRLIKIELLAIVEIIKEFKRMIWGQTVNMFTDHKIS
jgi:hypothetical protein